MSAIFERGQSVKNECLDEWSHTERPKKEVFAFEDGFNACHSKLVVEMICDVEAALKELKFFRDNDGPFGMVTGPTLDSAIERLEKYNISGEEI